MTQDELKMWCEAHECYVYLEKITEHGIQIFMRNSTDKKLMSVLFEPKNGKYRMASVCHICNTLKIPVPDYGKPMQEPLNVAKANCQKKD